MPDYLFHIPEDEVSSDNSYGLMDRDNHLIVK